MDESLTRELDQLNQDAISAGDEVSAAIDAGEDHRQLAAGNAVAELARRYQALIAQVPQDQRDSVERGVGRRVTDLRRAAMQLTRRDPGGRAADRSVNVGQPFLEQRMPPKSIVPQRAAPTGKLSVGGEIESWCGKCKEMRLHHIVALVSDEPKQVVCQTCRSRHGYKVDEPKRNRDTVPATPEARRAQQVVDREAQKRQDAKRALQKELAEAPNPRPFDPKGRYKAGEIIQHPEHGRGKIENVLKGSLLVRFSEGLRPLDLF